jgi:hypothetical protein
LSQKSAKVNAEFLIEALPKLVMRGEDSKPITWTTWTKIDRCHWHDHSGTGGKLRPESRKPPAIEPANQ